MTRTDLQAELDRIGPAPGSDPVERLRHVVRVYGDVDPTDEVITATRNVYGEPYWTGLNHGDLRELLEWCDSRALPRKDADDR